MREYATAPEVSVYGDPSFTFAYVPSHLHHMTFELVRQLENDISIVNVSTSEHHATRQYFPPLITSTTLREELLKGGTCCVTGEELSQGCE